ncbi:recombinase family protein [Chloroflexota bacterium]
MKTAAIYCRVSTDDQEREGTSLQTQLEACLNYCQGKGYDISYRFSEAYSGLTLERPKLDELRELVRAGDIDVVVIYCLDRLSRDPTHGVILTQELEKHNVKLEAVTEDVDNSELGKLISYIRGFASKLEAEKIRERTIRGKKAKAKLGHIPCGGYTRLYGYDYIAASYKGGGKRIVNENETKWVRKMFHLLVDDGMTTNAISDKLNSLSVPSKYGNQWSRTTVWKVLSNFAYTGKTFYYSDECIEMPNITPPIIEEALFKSAQRQLELNARKASRNVKRDYLLHGHIQCRQCGRPYWSHFAGQRRKYGYYEYRRYICSGKAKAVDSINRCHNKGWMADKLETIVWDQIHRLLSQPETIVNEIEKQRFDSDKISHIEVELKQVERQRRNLAKEQEQLLQWALKGFPEETVVAENKCINRQRSSLEGHKQELEIQLKSSQEAKINLPKLELFVKLIRDKLSALDFEIKRMVLEMLGIKVWIDGHGVEITGTIPLQEHDTIVLPQSRLEF